MASDPQTVFENNGVDRKRPKGEIRLPGLSDQNSTNSHEQNLVWFGSFEFLPAL
jgi:hypothetical protein